MCFHIDRVYGSFRIIPRINSRLPYQPSTGAFEIYRRPPGGDSEKLDSQLKSLESLLEKIKGIHKGNKPPSVHILGDFNFCDIVWPDRLSKSGSPLSRSEGEKFNEILNDHHLEQ